MNEDLRDEPAPFAVIVGLTAASAIAVIVISEWILPTTSLKFLLLGPIALVTYEVIVHEVWWKRWWGAIPGAFAGLVVYFEGRELLDHPWAEPVAYVAAWTLFAAVFCHLSRWPGSSRATPPGR